MGRMTPWLVTSDLVTLPVRGACIVTSIILSVVTIVTVPLDHRL